MAALPFTGAPGRGATRPPRWTSREAKTCTWSGRLLGLFGSVGRLRLVTTGATAWLWIEDSVPETLAIALVGRPVDALLSHPLLTDRDYTVLRAETDTVGTSVQVRTGLRRCRTPWTAGEALEAGKEAMLALLGATEARGLPS